MIKLTDDNLSTVSFADLEKLKLGERIFLVGITFDADNNPQTMVNEGIVKSFTTDFIKTNIFENYLLVGSPLFNVAGEALGLNIIDSEGKVITIPILEIEEFILGEDHMMVRYTKLTWKLMLQLVTIYVRKLRFLSRNVPLKNGEITQPFLA